MVRQAEKVRTSEVWRSSRFRPPWPGTPRQGGGPGRGAGGPARRLVRVGACGAYLLSGPMRAEADAMELAWSCGRLYHDFKRRVLADEGAPPSATRPRLSLTHAKRG